MVSDRTWFYDRPPPSAGNMVILTIVVQFSKPAHFVAFPHNRNHPNPYQTCLSTSRDPLGHHIRPGTSSTLEFGKGSVRQSEPRLVCLQDFTCRLMAKPNVPTRSWRQHFTASPPPNRAPGVLTSLASNMPILASRLLSHHRATNGGCSQQLRVSVWFPLFNIIYAGTATSGEPPELPNGKPMDCFQRSTFQSESSPGNWLPTSMGSLRLTPWSTLSQSSWSVLGACTEILFSMCLSSTLTCQWCSSLDRCTYLNLPGTLLVSCGPCWMNVSVSGFQCGVSLWACESQNVWRGV